MDMNGDAIVRAAREFLTRYVVLTPAQSITLAVYALYTWAYDAMARTVPYVEITGVSGSGKTILMESVGLLSRGAEQLTSMKPASIVRLATQSGGAIVLLCDEAERLASNSANELRGVLASGYRQGGYYPVSVGQMVHKYSCWCPKIFASTRSTVNVIHNRSIPIWMERGKAAGSLSTGYDAAKASAGAVVLALQRLIGYDSKVVADGEDNDGNPILRHRHTLKLRPVLLVADWLEDRDQEIFTPLFSFAASIGLSPVHMQELIAASIDLVSLRGIERKLDQRVDDTEARERSYSVRVLSDIRAVLQKGETKIPSSELVARLKDPKTMATSPWRSYRVNGLNEIALAALLGAFAIEPKVIRIGKRSDNTTIRGYVVADLMRPKV